MVLRLADALDVGLRDRNRLLEGAGLGAVYPREDLYGPTLLPFEQAIERLLHAHKPYPGLVVDGHWNVVVANHAAVTLVRAGPRRREHDPRFYGDPARRASIINVADVAWAGLARLRRQLRRTPLDEERRGLVELAEAAVADIPCPAELVICPDFRSRRGRRFSLVDQEAVARSRSVGRCGPRTRSKWLCGRGRRRRYPQSLVPEAGEIARLAVDPRPRQA